MFLTGADLLHLAFRVISTYIKEHLPGDLKLIEKEILETHGFEEKWLGVAGSAGTNADEHTGLARPHK